MTDLRPSEHDTSTLRWGGLAGIAGSILFLLVFVIVGVFVGADPAGPAGPIERFPEVRAGRTIENGLYLAVLILWVPSYVALSRALGTTRPASALFGSVLGIVALGVLAAGAVPHAATAPLSDAYHATGATAADREALVVAWQTTHGIFNALLVTGLGIVPFSLVLVGLAMAGSPAFGRWYAAVTIALGVAAGGSFVAMVIDPQSFMAVIGVFALILFQLLAGLRLYALARRAAAGGGGAGGGRGRDVTP